MPSPFSGGSGDVRRPVYCPRLRKPFFEILKITPEKRHELVILSSQVEAVLTHAVASRTQPCTGDAETCWLNHREYGCRWQGWLWVRRASVKEVAMVCLTPGTVEHCPELLDPGINLRGKKLLLWRKEPRMSSQLRGLLTASFFALDYLPEVGPMLDQLVKLWSAAPRSDRNRDCPATIAAIRAQLAAGTMVPL